MGGQLSDYTIGDLGVFIGTIGSVVTGILIVMQKSRCNKIKLCGCECDREPKKDKEEEKIIPETKDEGGLDTED